jgi:hypothetical protein
VARSLLLAEAKHQDVLRIVREALEERGALLDEQTHARTVFEGLGGGSRFRRGGYVGAYQPVGERGVEVLVEAWASTPRAVFWATVALELVAVIGLFVSSPPSWVWYVAGVVLWLWFGLVALLYYMTFRGSRAFEDEIASDLGERFRRAGLRIVGDEEQLEQRIRARLEGEVKERELARQRASRPAKPRFQRRARREPRAEPAAKPRKPGLFRPKPKA